MASTIISVTEFKAKAAKILAEIKAQEHTVVLAQNGRAAAVVQDYEAHQTSAGRNADAQAPFAGRGGHRGRQDQASARGLHGTPGTPRVDRVIERRDLAGLLLERLVR